MVNNKYTAIMIIESDTVNKPGIKTMVKITRCWMLQSKDLKNRL